MIKIEIFFKISVKKHVQLLLNCVGLQELHLQLVDTLDDPLWEQVILDAYSECDIPDPGILVPGNSSVF